MTRQDQIEQAARELIALEDGEFLKLYNYERESAIGAEKAKLRAALALPADPVSVDARERQLVRMALLGGPLGEQYGRDYSKLPEYARDQIDGYEEAIREAVNATHPRAPSVEAAVLGGALADAYDQAAKVCDDAATGAVDPGGIRRCAARIRALAPDCENCGEPSCTSSDCVRAIEAAAPSAPRDQGGGLREWCEAVGDHVDRRNRELRFRPEGPGEWGGLVWEAVQHAGPPPTDGVAAAYEGCNGLDTPERVRFYEHDFYPLSNFSAFSVRWRGIRFDTSEHAYHYEKFVGPDGDWRICEAIETAPSAHEAFKRAESERLHRRPDWDDIKVGIMREILRAKVEQHEYVKRKLLATGERELVEDSWRDDFWGWGPNRDGKNMLGKLWMELRAELRAPAPVSEKERAE